MQQSMQNTKDISDPTTALDMALKLMYKAFYLNNITPTNNNQRSSSNPFYSQIAQSGHLVGQNAVQNQGTQNVGNQNGLSVVLEIANKNGNGNVVIAPAEDNVKPRKRGVTYLQTQLQITQKEEAGIQLNFEEFDFMAAAGAYDEIEKVTTNYNLQDNLQQASTSGTQSDKAPVYDSDGSAEVHHSENCYDNDIFNMFTQEKQYTELLEPIPEPYQVPQNDNNVIYEVSSVEQSGGAIEQHPATLKETHALYDSLYINLSIEIEKVNLEKYDKLERCYQKSVYQEQCLTKKINAIHLSSAKQIMTLNEEISNLNKQLSKEKSIVSSFLEEKKRLKSDFKIREDELLDKQIQLENKINELDNILVKTGQSIQTMHMLSPKPDSFYHTELKMALGYQNPFYLKQAQQKQHSLYNGKVLLEKHDPPTVYDSEETVQLARVSRLKMKQLNKEIKPANYTKINHLSGGFVSQMAKSREESYFSNTSKMANVSKSFSIQNEEFSDDTTPSVARKFLNEIHKIVKDEIYHIVNQVDARVQNFTFVRDFQSLAKEADTLAKHKALELEIKRLLRAVVSQDIMAIVQNPSIVDSSNLQTELERRKERFENYIIKKENEYAKLWNDCKDTPCVSNTFDPLSQKLKNKNMELEFQVSEQKDTNKGTSVTTQFSKQSILGKPPFSSSYKPKLYSVTPFLKSSVLSKVDKMNALSKPVTSNSEPSSRESNVVNNERVIAPGIFRINPFKASRVANFVPNKHVKASVRTKPIIVSRPHVTTKNDVNSKTNGFSPKDVKSTTRTSRPQPRNNPKSDKVPFMSKSSCLSNKLEK
ncbi:hypothetical protein Tco_1109092 [Tanacetum coccineum]